MRITAKNKIDMKEQMAEPLWWHLPQTVRRQIYFCFSFYSEVLTWCLAQKKIFIKYLLVNSEMDERHKDWVSPSLPCSKGAWSQPEWRNSQMCSVSAFPGLPLREGPPAHFLTGPPTESPAPVRAALSHPPYTMAPWTSASPLSLEKPDPTADSS